MNFFKRSIQDKAFLALLVGVAVAFILEFLSLFKIELPIIARFILSVGLIGMFGREVLTKGAQALVKLNFKSINLLMLLAAVGAFYLREFEEATMVILLFTVAESLETFGFAESKATITQLLKQIPKVALRKGESSPVDIQSLQLGDLVIIKSGDIFPVDGKIHLGNALVDETSVTGEPLPKDKHPGDFVFAGTMNQNGYLEVEVLKKAENTTLAKVVELTLNATAQKSDTEIFIRRFSSRYIPFILICVGLILVVPPLFFSQPFDHWFKEALTLLVISCPCALVISTPLSFYAGMTNAATKGLLIKGGKYLELIGKVDTVMLDKTRTITTGKPTVTNVKLYRNFSLSEVLSCAGALEEKSEHPLAASVVQYVHEQNLPNHQQKNFKNFIGQGVAAECLTCTSGSQYLGKMSFVSEYATADIDVHADMQELESSGKTVLALADKNGVKGLISLVDQIKPESQNAIAELKDLGIDVIMLTGDNERSADYVAQKVGITRYKSNLLPQDKESILRETQEKGHTVAMVGDGINDSPALARAHVGISMGSAGSDMAVEAAPVSILNDNLELVPYLIRLGRKTIGTIKFNTWLAVITKFVFLGLAFAGHGQLVLAIVADVGLTLFVILNSLRLQSAR